MKKGSPGSLDPSEQIEWFLNELVKKLLEDVNAKIAEGYMPQGGVTLIPPHFCYQTMVLKSVLSI